MQKPYAGGLKHKKWLIVVVLLVVLVGGYFGYKYTYIRSERQKFDAAATALDKVASDLRAAGIETTSSRGCGRTQVEFGTGSLSCAEVLIYEGDQSQKKVDEVVKLFMNSLKSNGFTEVKYVSQSLTVSPLPYGSIEYAFKNNGLGCSIYLSNTWDINTSYKVGFDCGAPSKFNPF